MGAVSLSQFRVLVQALDGHTLETIARRQPFALHVEPSGLAFTLASTGKVRRESWDQIATVLDRFNEVQSFQPVHYTDLTRNSSYLMSVLSKLSDEM